MITAEKILNKTEWHTETVAGRKLYVPDKVINAMEEYAQEEVKYQCKYILDALKDIANWNYEMGEKWDDPKFFAQNALNEINKNKQLKK